MTVLYHASTVKISFLEIQSLYTDEKSYIFKYITIVKYNIGHALLHAYNKHNNAMHLYIYIIYYTRVRRDILYYMYVVWGALNKLFLVGAYYFSNDKRSLRGSLLEFTSHFDLDNVENRYQSYYIQERCLWFELVRVVFNETWCARTGRVCVYTELRVFFKKLL